MLEKISLRLEKKFKAKSKKNREAREAKEAKKAPKPPTEKIPRDISKDRCYRCLQYGHHSSTCPALYPVVQTKETGGN